MLPRSLFCVVFILAGCSTAPTTQIQNFGSAATKVTEHVGGVFDGYRDAAKERDYVLMADTFNKTGAKDFKLKDLDSIVESFNEKTRDAMLILESNNILAEYSKSLGELASSTSRNDIDIAASNVLYAVRDLNESYEKADKEDPLINEKEIASLVANFTGVGHFWVEYYRNKEIKKIVTTVDELVQIVCDQIAGSLEKKTMYSALKLEKKDILDIKFRDFKETVVNGNTNIDERILRLKKLKELKDSEFIVLLKAQQAIKAINEVKESHSALAKKLKESEFTGKEVVSSIKALRKTLKHYGDLDEYMAGCKKVTVKDGKLECEALD